MTWDIKKITLICTFLATSFYCNAIDWKAEIKREGGDDRWYCYTTFTIDPKGKWSSYSNYSNGRQWESGRFISTFTLKSKDGSDIITLTQNRHVRGSHAGRARTESTEERGNLPAEVIELINEGKTTYDCTVKSDLNSENLGKAILVAKWVLEL